MVTLGSVIQRKWIKMKLESYILIGKLNQRKVYLNFVSATELVFILKYFIKWWHADARTRGSVVSLNKVAHLLYRPQEENSCFRINFSLLPTIFPKKFFLKQSFLKRHFSSSIFPNCKNFKKIVIFLLKTDEK